MAEVTALARVSLWGKPVGAVAEDSDGAVTFEYEESFRRGHLEISPLHLPLSLSGPVRFAELERTEAFHGLPGVLADALPDKFGNAVIRRYFEERGEPGRSLSPVQRLLYVGSRAMGALEFQPALELVDRDSERMPLEIAELVEQSRRIIEGKSDVAVPEIMLVGASAGGMRPKALIQWNRATNVVRSAYAPPSPGDEPWMIKFDGVPPVGGDVTTTGTIGHSPQPFMRIEYAYSRMARAAGITLPETHLLTERDLAHFMVRRFDRIQGQRLHQHSLGGMLHVDYNLPAAVSYEEFLRLIHRLNLGQVAMEEAFRRVVFNIAGINQDDHVKNISFLMDGAGQWALSPAYDLTYAKGHGWTRLHQMTVAGKREGITRGDLEKLGRDFGLARRTGDIIAQVGKALAGWRIAASQALVPEEWITRIGEDIAKRGIGAAPPR